ncbi:hypothetical protein [Streptomyces synnematoformans]|uniref:hypothetical protein n=1 Tax=Streptomyces synnematoformans TaxID=415721 RepID=UPI0031DAF863
MAPNSSPSLADPALAVLAAVLDDLEDSRKANANRLRQLTRAETDSDGEQRGFGLTEDHPAVAAVAALVDELAKLEHQAVLALQRAMRAHPLGPWVRAQKGLGEKQAARLLAAIRDPYWNDAEDRPRRGPAELWQYAGHGDPARSKRRRGEHVQYSPAAKTRAYLIAKACMKLLRKPCATDPDSSVATHVEGCVCSPYRLVYDRRKAATEGRTHAAPCVRCGPSGKPAEAGSAWSAGHRNADALRVTAKAVLRDLWLEARRIHLETTQPTMLATAPISDSSAGSSFPDGHTSAGAHSCCAVGDTCTSGSGGHPRSGARPRGAAAAGGQDGGG